MNKRLFSKDFTLVVIGQIISLFGNAMVRFALPLYLLNQTGSSALYGTITACAFIPAIILSPIGGIVADRVNKRNIMVFLDFFTTTLILVYIFLSGSVNTILLIAVTLMLLYGIAGAYQPAVQASIPALISQEHFMGANSVINMISSLASLLGPVLGGILYSSLGLMPVLYLCAVCFFISAVMEIFIKIPFIKQVSEGNILKIAKVDFVESVQYIRREKPEIGKGVIIICAINLFLSAMITVGLPYIVTEIMDFSSELANTLYGYASGALAAGGIAGGICAGIFASRLSIKKAGNLLIICAICVFPMGAALLLSSSILSYIVITVCCFTVLTFSTIFSIQIMSFIQTEIPQNLIGKVIAVVLAVSMCAQPLGNALYGILFEVCSSFEFVVVWFAGVISLLIAFGTKNVFKRF